MRHKGNIQNTPQRLSKYATKVTCGIHHKEAKHIEYATKVVYKSAFDKLPSLSEMLGVVGMTNSSNCFHSL